MQEFFSHHWEIVSAIIAGMVALIVWLLKNALHNADIQEEKIEVHVDKLEIKIKEMEVEVKEMKDNYISRFEELMNKLNSMHVEFATNMGEIKSAMNSQANFCHFVQQEKRNNKNV